MEGEIDKLRIEEEEKEKIEEHSSFRGIVIDGNGRAIGVKGCWCMVHSIFRTRDLHEAKEGDITVYSLKGREIYPPLLFLSAERDLDMDDIRHLIS